MEAARKPSRYSAEEWEILQDLSDEDIPIEPDEYGAYLYPHLIDIASFAYVNGVEPPPIVVDILGFRQSDYKYYQWYVGVTKLDVQLWVGEQKEAIFKQARLS
jgi:hypothetical protein